jgi:hypothetical protein
MVIMTITVNALAGTLMVCFILFAGCTALDDGSGTDYNGTDDTDSNQNDSDLQDELKCHKPCHLMFGDFENDSFDPSCTASKGPIACTEIYVPQDACLALLDCKKENGSCKTVLRDGFYECLSCFRDCLELSRDNADALVCEKMCMSKHEE